MNKWDPNHSATYARNKELYSVHRSSDPLIPITIANVEHQHNMFLKIAIYLLIYCRCFQGRGCYIPYNIIPFSVTVRTYINQGMKESLCSAQQPRAPPHSGREGGGGTPLDKKHKQEKNSMLGI